MFNNNLLEISARYIEPDEHNNIRIQVIEKMCQGYKILGSKIDLDDYTITYLLENTGVR